MAKLLAKVQHLVFCVVVYVLVLACKGSFTPKAISLRCVAVRHRNARHHNASHRNATQRNATLHPCERTLTVKMKAVTSFAIVATTATTRYDAIDF